MTKFYGYEHEWDRNAGGEIDPTSNREIVQRLRNAVELAQSLGSDNVPLSYLINTVLRSK